MKTIISCIVISSIIFCCSDNSNNNPVSTEHEYSFSAKVANAKWQGRSYLDFANSDKQYLFLVPDGSYNYLTIKIPFHGIGEYQLGDSDAVLVETIGGDVLDGRYYSFSGSNDVLKINYFDENNEVIEGSFNFKIKKLNSVIEVKEGSFRANFINKQ
jgi:hypothetical protein